MGRATGWVRARVRVRVRFRGRAYSGTGVYGVMKTRRGHSSSFMAMEPRVTLEVRTSCRTWFGSGVGGRVRLGWRRMYHMPLLLPPWLGLGLGLELR